MPTLFAPQVSIAPTRRRRFLWVAWWTGAPNRDPFRKPDAFQGGARTREEAHAMAERAAGVPLIEIEPRWARAWGRIMVGQPAWPRRRGGGDEATGEVAGARPEGGSRAESEATADDPRAPQLSVWAILRVSPQASLEEVKQAFRTRAKEVHPDHGGSDADFIRLKRAYEEAQRRAARPKPRKRRR